jgi:hypothetical protein
MLKNLSLNINHNSIATLTSTHEKVLGKLLEME